MKIILLSGLHPDEVSPQEAGKKLSKTYDTIFVPNEGKMQREIYGEDLNRLFKPDLLSVENPTEAQKVAQAIINDVNMLRLKYKGELLILIDLHCAPQECYCYPHIKISLKRPIDRKVASWIAGQIPTVITDELTEFRFRQYYADRDNIVSLTIECGGGGTSYYRDVKKIIDAVNSIQKQKPAPFKVYREHFIELSRKGYFRSDMNLYNLLGQEVYGDIGTINYLNEEPVKVNVGGLTIGVALLNKGDQVYDGEVPWVINIAEEIPQMVK